MLYGLLDLSLKGYIVAIVVLTQITIACVTIYLHRSQTHRALTLHPIINHFFRCWLWLTTGIRTKEWVAIHRKHHANCETIEDPHSPKYFGLKNLLLKGSEIYRYGKSTQTIETFGHGTPDDWVERHIYTPHDKLGIFIMLTINVLLFGLPGVSIWALQMIWIPFFAGGVVNGLGHCFGYRNFEPNDNSTNIIPFAFIIGGEELHNNHHAFPSSAKLSFKWWEFDMGWLYIKILSFLKLAHVNRVTTKLHYSGVKLSFDTETLKLIINNRLQVLADYCEQVIVPAITTEDINNFPVLINAENLLARPDLLLDSEMKKDISTMLKNNPILDRLYQFKHSLQNIWEMRSANQQELIVSFKKWINLAVSDGNPLLRKFAIRLQQYSA